MEGWWVRFLKEFDRPNEIMTREEGFVIIDFAEKQKYFLFSCVGKGF